jgi:ATP-binding cassette subfamily B protein RaxB
VAITGPSGSGKTTLMKLMAGLMAPQQGEVLVGGITLQALGLREYRRMIGTVMQDDQLLAGSIADNICFFDLERDLAWLTECARMAAIHDDIQAMPMRYDTLIGDMGAAISGGQKQRILLARALYKKPSILLLDEATSHLDVALERAVNAVVGSLKITRVIIAHRPETIASADRVIPLQSVPVGYTAPAGGAGGSNL